MQQLESGLHQGEAEERFERARSGSKKEMFDEFQSNL